ncbi:MAG: signal peptidase I [Oscillospiraceae bacterium]|nr:signal peptidase I [Oscillospiraceae bacterium]
MESKTDVKIKAVRKPLRELYDWAESILIGLITVVVVLTFAIRGTRVDGASMLPTLEDSQFLAISNLYCTLNYNDIVVVYAKDIDLSIGGGGRPVIKRVIGLEGDRIGIDSQSGVVYRNGEALPIEIIGGIIYEDGHTIKELTRNRGDMYEDAEWVVPSNSIFVMGDNRNNSKDSRSEDVGMVNENYVIGKVLFRVTPFDKFGQVK